MRLAGNVFRMGDEAFGRSRLLEALMATMASPRRLLQSLTLPQPQARAWVDPDLKRGLDVLGLRIEIAEHVLLSRGRGYGRPNGSDRLRAYPCISLAGDELTERSAAPLAAISPRGLAWRLECGRSRLISSPAFRAAVTSRRAVATRSTLLRSRRSDVSSILRLLDAFATRAHARLRGLLELHSPRQAGPDLRQPPNAPRETYATSQQLNRAFRAAHCDSTSTRHPDPEPKAAKAERRVVGRSSRHSRDDRRGRVRDHARQRNAVDVHAGRAECRARRQPAVRQAGCRCFVRA
jgi:hypothetical protein